MQQRFCHCVMILVLVIVSLILCTSLSVVDANESKKTTGLTQEQEICKKGNESCSACTDSEKCYWCEPTKSCHVYEGKKVLPRDCPDKKWFWKQCVIPGNLLIIIIPSVAGVVLIFLICCIYCCCCRRYKKWRLRRMDKQDAKVKRKKEERVALQTQKKTERQAKRDAIRDKYGLPGSTSSHYQRLPDNDH